MESETINGTDQVGWRCLQKNVESPRHHRAKRTSNMNMNEAESTLRIRLSDTSVSDQTEKRAQDRILSALLSVASDDSLAQLFKECEEVYFGDGSELSELKAARDRALADQNAQTLGALSLAASAFARSAWRAVFNWAKMEYDQGGERYQQARIWARDAEKNRSHLRYLELAEQQEYWSAVVALRQLPDLGADIRRTTRALQYSFEVLARALQSVESAPDLVPLAMSASIIATDVAYRAGLRFRDMSEAVLADSGRSVSYLERAAELAAKKRNSRSGGASADDESIESTTHSGSGHSVRSDVNDYEDTNTQTSFGTDPDHGFTSDVDWDDSFDVNPSTGLPMIDGGVLDVGGHVFGTGIPGDGW